MISEPYFPGSYCFSEAVVVQGGAWEGEKEIVPSPFADLAELELRVGEEGSGFLRKVRIARLGTRVGC